MFKSLEKTPRKVFIVPSPPPQRKVNQKKCRQLSEVRVLYYIVSGYKIQI